MYAFTYQKALLHTLFCLFLKLPKAFSVSLIRFYLGYFLSFNEVSFLNYALIGFKFHSKKIIMRLVGHHTDVYYVSG